MSGLYIANYELALQIDPNDQCAKKNLAAIRVEAENSKGLLSKASDAAAASTKGGRRPKAAVRTAAGARLTVCAGDVFAIPPTCLLVEDTCTCRRRGATS